MSVIGNTVMPMFDYMVDSAVKAIIPTLSTFYSDESPERLAELWDKCWFDFSEEPFLLADSKYTRLDCAYVDGLLNELRSFLIISMENDW